MIHEDVTEESYLLSAGYRDLEESARLLSTITLNAIDLHLLNVDVEKIKLGDSIRVVSAPHGLDAYMQVSAMNIKLAQPQNSTITVGRLPEDAEGRIRCRIIRYQRGYFLYFGVEKQTAGRVNGLFTKIEEYRSEITKTAEQILMTVSESYLLKSDFSAESRQYPVADQPDFQFHPADCLCNLCKNLGLQYRYRGAGSFHRTESGCGEPDLFDQYECGNGKDQCFQTGSDRICDDDRSLHFREGPVFLAEISRLTPLQQTS